MANGAGDQKPPRTLHAIQLGDGLVLLSMADDEETRCSFDDGASGEDEALSAAERAVAELAARGLANADIARTRGVANRTIANQLAEVYRKLGLSGRRELRAWFRERRSGDIEKAR